MHTVSPTVRKDKHTAPEMKACVCVCVRRERETEWETVPVSLSWNVLENGGGNPQ